MVGEHQGDGAAVDDLETGVGARRGQDRELAPEVLFCTDVLADHAVVVAHGGHECGLFDRDRIDAAAPMVDMHAHQVDAGFRERPIETYFCVKTLNDLDTNVDYLEFDNWFITMSDSDVY